MITRQKAFEIINQHLKNKNLIRHCLAVEATMKALAKHFKENEKPWGLVGLMHDADWEETQNDPSLHTKKTIEWLKEAGETGENILQCILSHNHTHNGEKPPSTPMEWSLYICDELTGFIVAVALVRPEKKLSAVTVDSVIKKFPAKSFAAGVHREQILLCEEKLGIKPEDFVMITLRAMQEISADLGL